MGKQKPVRCKYVLKKKLNEDMSLQFKSRLVACGYSQVPGLDYSIDETYAGVLSYSSMRFLISLICQQKGYVRSQTDIQGEYSESSIHRKLRGEELSLSIHHIKARTQHMIMVLSVVFVVGGR